MNDSTGRTPAPPLRAAAPGGSQSGRRLAAGPVRERAGRRRTRFFRLLPALAPCLLATVPAPAQTNLETTVLSTELTVDARGTYSGCSSTEGVVLSPCSTQLKDGDFTHDGVTYEIVRLCIDHRGDLDIEFNKDLSPALRDMALHLDGTTRAFYEGPYRSYPSSRKVIWNYPGLSWTEGQKVSVKLTTPAPPGGLTAYSKIGALYLEWWGPSDRTSVGKVTGFDVEYKEAEAADVAGTGGDASTGWVPRGGYSISPVRGSSLRTANVRGLTPGTRYDVRVRARYAGGVGPWARAAGTPWSATTLTLSHDRAPVEGGGPVTVSARLNAPAPAGGTAVRLVATGSATGGGTDYTLSTTDIDIASGATSGTATIRVTDDTVSEGDETIILDATSTNPALTANTLVLTITDNDVPPPAAPTHLSVTAGSGRLSLRWTAPSGTVTGYDVHYTSAAPGSVAGDATVQSGGSGLAASGWVDAGHTGTTASRTISSLANDTAYRVRVRAVNAAGESDWVHGTGTPTATPPPPPPPPPPGGTVPPPPPPDNESLSALVLSAGALALVPGTTAYTVAVPYAVASLTLTPSAGDSGATLTVNGVAVASGEPSAAIALAVGETLIPIVITAPGGATRTYAVTVTRAPAEVALLPAASSALHGFVRVINESDEAGTVTVRAFDDAGAEYAPVTLGIGAGAAVQLSAHDLESGNPDKGLTGATGPGQGRWWRLVFESELDFRALGYVRTADGFVTSMHEEVAERQSDDGYRYEVVFFNPASNAHQVSRLRLVNRAHAEAAVTITGTDDAGDAGEEAVTLTLPARVARTLSAPALESGDGEGLDGMLGDGAGKWRLSVDSDRPLAVMSLLENPTGHLTNLSTAPPASR